MNWYSHNGRVVSGANQMIDINYGEVRRYYSINCNGVSLFPAEICFNTSGFHVTVCVVDNFPVVVIFSSVQQILGLAIKTSKHLKPKMNFHYEGEGIFWKNFIELGNLDHVDFGFRSAKIFLPFPCVASENCGSVFGQRPR